MICDIRHRMEYRYTSPVSFEAHQLHLMPRTDGFQRLLQFSIRISPEPSSRNQLIDVFGNPAHEIWFNGKSDRLAIEAYSRVETFCVNPFDYLVCESSVRLPVVYPELLQPGLAVYKSQSGDEPSIRDYAGNIARKAGHETIGFLSEVCLDIHRTVRYLRREDASPHSPAQILAEKKGSCRDLAILFIACCRSQGLAARFTSGYMFGNSDFFERDLHAWAEVYIEGGGWRGYDPSTGLAVCDQYVALASGPVPQLVTPSAGTFRGAGMLQDFQTSVSVSPFTEARVS